MDLDLKDGVEEGVEYPMWPRLGCVSSAWDIGPNRVSCTFSNSALNVMHFGVYVDAWVQLPFHLFVARVLESRAVGVVIACSCRVLRLRMTLTAARSGAFP